jgi:hypothetical protein
MASAPTFLTASLFQESQKSGILRFALNDTKKQVLTENIFFGRGAAEQSKLQIKWGAALPVACAGC